LVLVNQDRRVLKRNRQGKRERRSQKEGTGKRREHADSKSLA
jgi:hypothetical protein